MIDLIVFVVMVYLMVGVALGFIFNKSFQLDDDPAMSPAEWFKTITQWPFAIAAILKDNKTE